MVETNPFVSVVMPVYNEERYIEKCIESLILQDYPKDCMEWIFVDGCSQDSTVSLIEKYRSSYPHLIKILSNPNKTVPYAMNIGIREAKGIYIIRLDAHAEYANDYFSKCVEVLEETDADNVGGVAETKSNGFIGNTIAKMLSSKFGVGNSQFRTDGEDGFVDTVPFGAFRHEIFEKWGGYDERLTRNQDNEMNFRIRKNGGKVFLSNRIKLSYYCRDSISGIAKMGFQNGAWNVITMKLCPGSMGIRHFVPLLFVCSLIFLPLLSLFLYPIGFVFAIELAAYLSLDVLFSVKAATGIEDFLLLIFLFPFFHICYGIGSIWGFVKLTSKEFRN